MKRLLLAFLRETRGVTSSEYALLAAGIAGVLFAVVAVFGLSVRGLFQAAVQSFQSGP